MRDPRIDPQPGDVLKDALRTCFVVNRWPDSLGGSVDVFYGNMSATYTIERWRSLFADDRVIAVGGVGHVDHDAHFPEVAGGGE